MSDIRRAHECCPYHLGFGGTGNDCGESPCNLWPGHAAIDAAVKSAARQARIDLMTRDSGLWFSKRAVEIQERRAGADMRERIAVALDGECLGIYIRNNFPLEGESDPPEH